MLFCKKDVKELNLTVPDMHCTHCSAKIESTVKAVKGVKRFRQIPKPKRYALSMTHQNARQRQLNLLSWAQGLL